MPNIQSAFVRIALAGLLALGTSACGDPTPDYRYRLTVEVETPEGLKSGSSVIEVETSVAGEYSIPTPGRVSHRLRGEAVAVDLPGGRTLFALLRSDSDADWAKRVMFVLASSGGDFQSSFDAMLSDRSEKTLPRYFRDRGHLRNQRAYPMLVTFGDLSDPTSVAAVDPDDLAASFGEGYALQRITVQLTDDPVTTGIEERLGWLEHTRGAISKIPMTERPPVGTPLPLHATLSETSFRIGER